MPNRTVLSAAGEAQPVGPARFGVPGLRRPSWLIRAVAAATTALGLLDIISGITPELRSRLRMLHGYLPFTVTHAAAAATVVAGILLVVVAHGLRRRKRRAWWAAVGLLTLSTALHLAKGLDYEEASVTAALAVALVPLYRHFFAVSDPLTRWRAPVTLAALLGCDVAVGLGLLSARRGMIAGPASYVDRLQEVAYGLVGATGPLQYTSDHASDLVYAVLLSLGVVTVIWPTLLLFRAAGATRQRSPEQDAALRNLVERHGAQDSLGYFTLRDDKSVLFSASGKSAISYRVVAGVMLAAGDPVGDPEAWPGAIRVFLAEAARHACVPAVIGCSERGGEVWVREAGLHALELGDEAVVDVETFSLEGRAMRNVRQMVHRVERLGYQTCMRRIGEIPAEEVAEIRAQAAAWRGSETERGFSMALGRFGEPGDRDCVAVTARKDGQLRAVLHFVPWGRDGLSLDLMRRDRAADPGLNDLLIVAALRAASGLGVRRVSLNFAVFRSALERGAQLGAGPVLRAWRGFLIFASRWFQIESLYRFNAKFRPDWQARYICYPSSRDIPRIAVAALEAEAFLVLPKLPLTRHRFEAAPRSLPRRRFRLLRTRD